MFHSSIKKHPIFTPALITASKRRKHPKYSSIEARIKKMWCMCTMEYYTATRKKEILPLNRNMDGLRGHYAK